MNQSIEISSRLREVFLNGKFIANTNYKEQLSRLSHEQAVAKFQDLNSIAALAYHINYYLDGILNVFNGGNLDIHDKFSFDLPLVNTENDWFKLRDSLLENAELFARHVETMSNQQLDSVFVDEKYGTYRRNIEGVLEHSYYHLGQISLIIKLLKV